jgi:bla regulator protein BlaR1
MTPAFLQNELVRAFCWTLIHSLWQGLILAAVTGLILLFTRRSNAKKRYALLSVVFFLFLVVTAGTFIRELGLTRPAAALPVSSDQLIEQAFMADAGNGANPSGLAVVKQGWVQRFVDYFNTHAAMVVTIWFIIFFARLLQLGGNLFYIQRLRSYRTRQTTDQWKEKLSELANRIGVQIKVQLLESAIVKVPVTMGVLKPVILLPLGLLAQLPADEIEAILLHELAHIKRRDYFVNLLQSFAETIFFFNPALLWLSSLIRDERENCCDDIAIAITNNKTNFINALISFQEYHFAKPPYGMAFPGQKQQLLNRVKRIVNNSNKTLNAAEKSLLGFGMALLLVFSFVTAQQSPVKPLETTNKSGAQKPEVQGSKTRSDKSTVNDQEFKQASLALTVRKDAVLTDTVVSPITKLDAAATEAVNTDITRITGKMEMRKDTNQYRSVSISSNTNSEGEKTEVMTVVLKSGNEYRVKKINDVLKEFSVNGRQIPESEFGNYKADIDMVDRASHPKREDEKRHRESGMDKHKDQREIREHEIARKLDLIKEERVKRDVEKQIKDWKGAKELSQEYEKRKFYMADSTRVTLDKKVKEFEKRSIEHKKDIKKQIDKQIEEQELHKQKLAHVVRDSVKGSYRIKDDHRVVLDLKGEWMLDMQEEDAARMKASASVMRNIINDLEKENVKIDTQKSWFALDNDKFIVDGKAIPKDLHEKFKNKYIRNGGGYYYGRVQVSGRGIFLANKDVPAK